MQAALHASGLSMPTKKVTVNLAPADLPEEGSHYDLPIALGLMAALGAIPGDALADYVVLGANPLGKGLICPADSGPEAAWAGSDIDILTQRSLIAIAPFRQPQDPTPLQHLKDSNHAGDGKESPYGLYMACMACRAALQSSQFQLMLHVFAQRGSPLKALEARKVHGSTN